MKEYKWYYDDELSCLEWIAEHPRGDPYTGASGIVREVAIDKWLNRHDADGYLIVHKIDPTSVSVSKLGKAYITHMKKWNKVRKHSLESKKGG